MFLNPNVKISNCRNNLEQEYLEEIHDSIKWDYPIYGMGFIAKATKTGKTIGYININVDSPKTLEIPYLAVHVEYQKSGIGKQLFEQAIRKAKEENFTFVTLTCRAAKVGDFYRKQARRLNLNLEETDNGQYSNGDLSSRFVFTLQKDFSCLHFFSGLHTF